MCRATDGSAAGAPPTMAAAGADATRTQARAETTRSMRRTSAPRPPPLSTVGSAKNGPRLRAVAQSFDALFLGAVRAAEDRVVFFDPVADDMRAAIRACRCQRLDGAFEAVERVRGAVHLHLECLVVIVAAGFASGHGCLR